jgi:D-sedoheptulose 7-phosphate isomerase
MNNKDLILQELHQSHSVLTEFMTSEKNIAAIENAANIMIACIKNGGKIIACGNGGSMSDAMHFASELTGRYRKDRGALPALAISDPGHLSCVANDYEYDHVFQRFLDAHARGINNDVLLAISTSGESQNVLNAASLCKNRGIKVISLTGKKNSTLSVLSNIEICVGHNGHADRNQEIHIKIIHILVMLIEKGVFDEQ